MKKLPENRTKLDGDALKCPACSRTVAKARYGASVQGVTVLCPRCSRVVELYLSTK